MKKIGFIGLGNMGKGMSINLSKENLEIIGYDINENAYKDLKDKNQFLGSQVPGLAAAVQRMGLCPDLLHVDPCRFAQRHGVHGPPAGVAGGIAQEAFVVDTGKQDGAPCVAGFGARVGAADLVMAARDE